MKSVALLSASLILATIPSTFAIPTSRGIGARWVKSGAKSVQEPSTNAAAADAEQDYIVVLADDEKRPWSEVFKSMGWNTTETIAARSVDGHDVPTFRAFETDEGESIQTFGTHIRAFTMTMKKTDGASIQSLPNVAIMEKDHKRSWAVMPRKTPYRQRNMPRSVVPYGQTLPVGFEITKRQAPGNSSDGFLQQSTAPWNLQRISSQGTVTSNGRRVTDLNFDYRFDRKSGLGVDVYMIDSGFNVQHVDFGGRLQVLFSPSQDGGKDTIGHGTHTSGTVGSLTYGVAKNVNIFGAKVGDDAPTDSALVAGLDAAINQHNQRKTLPGFAGSVISMSLGGPELGQTLFSVVQRASQAGMHISIAAGNDNRDACGDFPGGFNRQLPIINVGATDVNDNRANFSNFGPCVDIHAPGVDIVSTFNTGPQSVDSLQGTSMACPAVTGMIAYELTLNPNLRLDPAGMKKHILSKALPNVIKGTQGVTPGGFVMLNNDFPGNPAPRPSQ
ncbi:hypothetical protein Dda_5008 [Drechslerella dactyloides]|uniref:Peptidase S8/S53 domain-containing protein n=1 Tax=Drechslerella dactyloides TaxID=74499 RepID=A0AAD6IZF9_DREDA|nr:hypothetical protein Dda_5008 [Drechslerella dactyloides]